MMSHISDVLPAVVPPRPRALDDLIREFEAHEALENEDAVVPMNKLWFTNDGTLIVPEHQGAFALNDWSRRQLSALVGLASWEKWFSRMTPEDRAAEINKRLWSSSKMLRVRTGRPAEKTNGVEGVVRALVSPTFSPIPDSSLLGLLKAALEPVEPELRILHSSVTVQTVTYTIGVGHAFRPGDDHLVGDCWGGICIQNSGVGFSSLRIVANLTRLLCTNGMRAPVPGADLLKRVHRAFNLDRLREVLIERLSELPGKLADAARALVASRSSRADDPRPAFLEILRRARLPQGLLSELERAYDAEPALKGSAFGISQAATRAAQSMSAEDRFRLEQAAGEYIANLSRTVN